LYPSHCAAAGAQRTTAKLRAAKARVRVVIVASY
jgi:hypothetical protein